MSQFLGFGQGISGEYLNTTPLQYDPGVWSVASVSAGATNVTISSNFNYGNGAYVAFCQQRGTGVGAWELNKVVSGNGSSSLTLELPLDNTYTDSGSSQAQMVHVYQFSQFNVNSTIFPAYWDGGVGGIMAFMCSGETNIPGIMTVANRGYRGGSSQAAPGPNPANGYQGEGTSGDRNTASQSANGNGGGGGREPDNNGGAGGGYAVAGETNVNAIGGGVVGSDSMSTIFFGGAGGGAPAGGGGLETGQEGGNGGGIVLIFSRVINVTGSIVADGESKVGNFNPPRSFAGGGGAGGSIFLKGQTVNIGNNLLSAQGGTSTGNRAGGDGGTGRIRVEGCAVTGSSTLGSFSKSEGGFDFCGSFLNVVF